jgi:hypothetical protein
VYVLTHCCRSSLAGEVLLGARFCTTMRAERLHVPCPTSEGPRVCPCHTTCDHFHATPSRSCHLFPASWNPRYYAAWLHRSRGFSPIRSFVVNILHCVGAHVSWTLSCAQLAAAARRLLSAQTVQAVLLLLLTLGQLPLHVAADGVVEVVMTPQEWTDALTGGVRHIVVRAHLDLADAEALATPKKGTFTIRVCALSVPSSHWATHNRHRACLLLRSAFMFLPIMPSDKRCHWCDVTHYFTRTSPSVSVCVQGDCSRVPAPADISPQPQYAEQCVITVPAMGSFLRIQALDHKLLLSYLHIRVAASSNKAQVEATGQNAVINIVDGQVWMHKVALVGNGAGRGVDVGESMLLHMSGAFLVASTWIE